ncbi:uncharacterized protein VTP21DRAFT_763 [Calcarisporiella thermophila]|uniref:uncharacterized protein n=1 Tax=Calcarisporiella thermophila TaxID=911321 RepID=UPI0037447546
MKSIAFIAATSLFCFAISQGLPIDVTDLVRRNNENPEQQEQVEMGVATPDTSANVANLGEAAAGGALSTVSQDVPSVVGNAGAQTALTGFGVVKLAGDELRRQNGLVTPNVTPITGA